MIGRNLRYLVALAACAILPLAGCSGGGSSPTKVTEKGVEVTVSGKVADVAAAKTAAKTTAKTAITLNTVQVTNALDGAALGSATVASDGSFTGLTFTMPSTKTVLVFKATVAQGTFLSLVPIDLSNPPAAGTIVDNKPINVVISEESTARALLVSQLLGLTGDLGDTGQTLASVSKTYVDAATLVVNNGGQQLAYSVDGGSLALSSKFSNTNLLPAVNVATLGADQLEALRLTGTVTMVAIPGSKPIVSFQVTNAAGKGVTGLAKSLDRFAIATLVPGTTASPSDEWMSYMVTSATSNPSSERNTASDYATRLIDNGDGSYTYIFTKDIKALTSAGVPYVNTQTHRVGFIINGTPTGAIAPLGEPAQVVYDFLPAGGTPTVLRDIVTTAACNECHTKIGVTTPHTGRGDTRFCVLCHTKQRGGSSANVASAGGVFDVAVDQRRGDGENFGEFVTMVHKIHMGNKLSKTGYNYDGVLFNQIPYPWGNTVANCRKCHQTGEGTQGDNWQTKPTRKSCGSCHDNINFATGANSKSGVAGHMTGNHIIQLDDSACATCHAASSTAPKMSPANAHLTNNATTNNPTTKTGLVNFTYQISSVTVDEISNIASIKFRILKDGVALASFDGDSTNILSGFTSGPSFLFASYKPTGNAKQNAASSVDFNNFRAGATASVTGANQPKTVSLASLFAQLIPANRDADGYYTVTVANGFPAGAKLRNVGLQGTFTQTGTTAITGSATTARQTTSAVKAVAGEERRVVVDQAKCLNCHEWISGHGGSRINNPQICTFCHVPNLSSSGKTFNLGHPEATQNLKDMIHSIHAGVYVEDVHEHTVRTNAYKHTRAKGNTTGATSATVYDWSDVKFPGLLSECQMCHLPGTYGAIPAGALVTTDANTDGINASVASVFTFRNYTTILLGTDKVTTPFTAACVSCHDSSSAKVHMTTNGGSIEALRSSAADAESCAVCHAAGRAASYHK